MRNPIKSMFVVYLLAASFIDVFSFHVKNCDYIDGDKGSVKIWCGFESLYENQGECYNDLIKSVTSAKNRSNVTKLKIDETACAILDKPLDEIFDNVREFDFTNAASSILPLNYHFKQLEKLNASHGQIMLVSVWNFREELKLKVLDLSYNKITDIVSSTFSRNRLLVSVYLSHNDIANLGENVFYGLSQLQLVDFSYNRIANIDRFAFQSNVNLTVLRLENNPLKTFDCRVFVPLQKLNSLSVTLDHIEVLELSCVGGALTTVTNNPNDIAVRLSTTGPSIRCSKKDFQHLTNFLIGGNQIHNVSDTLELLPSDLQGLDLSSINLATLNFNAIHRFISLTFFNISNSSLNQLSAEIFSHQPNLAVLDISYNNFTDVDFVPIFEPLKKLKSLSAIDCHLINIESMLRLVTPTLEELNLSNNLIGKLNPSTFQPFTNLRRLNLSHTGLSNFGFSTFYHQTKLRSLDISYNHLKRIDFTLFARNFHELRILYMEGNQFDQLNTMTPYIFPNLTTLAVSKNQFSCHYLTHFWRNWTHLHFVSNPTPNQAHISGTDCIIIDEVTETTMAKFQQVTQHPVIIIHSESHIVKYSLLFLCVMCCGYVAVKSKLFSRLRETWAHNSLGDNVGYQQSTIALMNPDNQ